MADRSAQPEATEAEKADTTAEAPAPVEASAPAEAKAEPVEASPAAEAGRPVRRAAPKKVEPKKIEKAVAAPAPKAARKVKKTPTKKKAVTAVSAAAARPVRAGLAKTEIAKTKGASEMTNKTHGVDAGLFAADQFKTVFGDVNERAKAAMERSARVVEELADLTRGNVEAFVASSKVAAKGVETLSQEAAEYSRKSFEEASAALKGLSEVKSATDLFKLQGDFARAAFDGAVAESARLSENVLKLVGDVAEPLTARYTVAAERVKTLAA